MARRWSGFSREAQVVTVIRSMVRRRLPLNIASVVDELRFAEAEQGFPPFGKSADRIVGSVLRSLEAAGILTRRDDGQFGRPSERADQPFDPDDDLSELLQDGWVPPGGGNQPPSPPPVPPGGSDGNSGNAAPGDGYRELLSHPYLFSLPNEDFELLLGAIGEPS